MRLLDWIGGHPQIPPPDERAVRERLRADPEYRRAVDVKHDLDQIVTLKRNHDDYHALLRRSWEDERGRA